ncbi:unnamed protein product, partial [Didymodactylos carnosus]
MTMSLIRSLILFIVIVALCSKLFITNARTIQKGLIPAGYYLPFDLDFDADDTNDEEYIHAKRKSEMFSSLYTLPYQLFEMGKRN